MAPVAPHSAGQWVSRSLVVVGRAPVPAAGVAGPGRPGLTAARPTRAWWVASVAAMVVGGFGVLAYWCGGALTSFSETDAEGEVGPGVPLFTLGFVAVVIAAALRLRAGDARRSPAAPLAP